MDIKKFIKKIIFKGSEKYWESRYKRGGNSGRGSYGKLAKFKAEVINQFIKEKNITTVVEFGCGDGNQLELGKYGLYLGIDVSKSAIKICEDRFRNDHNKNFQLFNKEIKQKYELSLSLDVIFHLIEYKIFNSYMEKLFETASKYVIIYSSNTNYNKDSNEPHFKNRKFSTWIEINKPEWELYKLTKNKYSTKLCNDKSGSIAEFYFYRLKK